MDETSKSDSENVHFAPTVVHANKAIFIVRVSYFIQVKLFFGVWPRPVKIKLPFMLKRPDPEPQGPITSESKSQENDISNTEDMSKKENDE